MFYHGNDYVLSWQSKGLSNESIKPPKTSNNSLNPRLSYYGTKVKATKTTKPYFYS